MFPGAVQVGSTAGNSTNVCWCAWLELLELLDELEELELLDELLGGAIELDGSVTAPQAAKPNMANVAKKAINNFFFISIKTPLYNITLP